MRRARQRRHSSEPERRSCSGGNCSGRPFREPGSERSRWTFEGQEFAPMQTVADYTAIPFDNTAFTIGAIVTS